jgi:TRAP-type C4-dicarboxylate transport system permease small subunit
MSAGRLLRWFVEANRVLNLVLSGVVGLLILAMAGVVIVGVYYRYVLNSALIWGGELTRYLTVWLVFLGVCVGHHRADHIRISTVVNALPAAVRRAVELIAELVVLALLLAIAWYGWKLAASNLERGQITPALQIRIGWVYLAIPVGLGLTAFQSVEKVLVAVYELAGGRLDGRPDVDERDISSIAAG